MHDLPSALAQTLLETIGDVLPIALFIFGFCNYSAHLGCSDDRLAPRLCLGAHGPEALLPELMEARMESLREFGKQSFQDLRPQAEPGSETCMS